MKTLVVEDDFTSRRLLQRILAKYGDVDVATNGVEALQAFRLSMEESTAYDLICLDIMMPELDGQEVLKEIRRREAEKGIHLPGGAKIIMTTALGDRKNIMEAFRSQCEAYLVKPIDKRKLLEHLRDLSLIEEGVS